MRSNVNLLCAGLAAAAIAIPAAHAANPSVGATPMVPSYGEQVKLELRNFDWPTYLPATRYAVVGNVINVEYEYVTDDGIARGRKVGGPIEVAQFQLHLLAIARHHRRRADAGVRRMGGGDRDGGRGEAGAQQVHVGTHGLLRLPELASRCEEAARARCVLLVSVTRLGRTGLARALAAASAQRFGARVARLGHRVVVFRACGVERPVPARGIAFLSYRGRQLCC